MEEKMTVSAVGVFGTLATLALLVFLSNASNFWEQQKNQGSLSPEQAAREIFEQGKPLTFERVSAIGLSADLTLVQRLIDLILKNKKSGDKAPLKFHELRGIMCLVIDGTGPGFVHAGDKYSIYTNPDGGVFFGHGFNTIFGEDPPSAVGTVAVVNYRPSSVNVWIKEPVLRDRVTEFLKKHPVFKSWKIEAN